MPMRYWAASLSPLRYSRSDVEVFIDTNILLQFYEATRADLREIEKMLALASNGKMRLLVSPQVRDEFLKNREGVIEKALQQLHKHKFRIDVPNLYTGLPSWEPLMEGMHALEKTRKELLLEARDAIANDALKADRAVRTLLQLAGSEPPDDELVERARLRIDRGNPPGKKGLGDAINWEWLMDTVRPGSDIHIITDDGDYSSRMDRGLPSEFLGNEWRSRKRGELCVYGSLLEFVKAKFPELLDVEDIDKHLAIEALATSPNFRSTHHAISRLNRYESFSSSEKAALLQAIVDNDQVHWIIADKSVWTFTSRLLGSLGEDEHPELQEAVGSLLFPESPEDDEWAAAGYVSEADLPF